MDAIGIGLTWCGGGEGRGGEEAAGWKWSEGLLGLRVWSCGESCRYAAIDLTRELKSSRR